MLKNIGIILFPIITITIILSSVVMDKARQEEIKNLKLDVARYSRVIVDQEDENELLRESLGICLKGQKTFFRLSQKTQ